MIIKDIKDDYFKWLYDLMCHDRGSKKISYKRLFRFLHSAEFTYTIFRDKNRAHDGIDLRYRYARSLGYDSDYFADYLEGPCSVLEMMIALALRCEETIMDDPRFGDRTTQWFWGMISSLGLNGMDDSRFDHKYAYSVIERFLRRDYEPNGKGGLFTIKNCDRDLRDVEIWYQLNWYLDTII